MQNSSNKEWLFYFQDSELREGIAGEVMDMGEADYIYSKPTKCLKCHLVVEMTHKSDADPVKGA